MDLVITYATIADFERIFPLFVQLWPSKIIDKAQLKETYENGIQSDTDMLLCAVLDNQIVGFCAYAAVNNLWQEGKISYIYAMIVDENFRGQGIGTHLIQEVLSRSKLAGMKRVELDSGFPREMAHKFYEKIGFEKRAYLFSYIL